MRLATGLSFNTYFENRSVSSVGRYIKAKMLIASPIITENTMSTFTKPFPSAFVSHFSNLLSGSSSNISSMDTSAEYISDL